MIDFPSNPTNGQVYGNYIYDSSITAWRNVNTDTGIGTLNAMGLKNVVPTSVAVGSGSATTNGNGLVTFSGATSISLNGVFTGTYKNYRIIMNLTSNSALSCLMRMRASGADVTTATYNQAGYSSSGSTLAAFNATALTYVILFDTYVGIDTGASYDIFEPQLVSQTTFSGVAVGVPGGSVKSQAANLYHSVAAAYDGFSLITNSANTITGTVQVFGYTN